jgi:hypothetical protein
VLVELLFTFADPRIAESSGLASSSTPGIVFTHNDSGDAPRFFAVDATGQTVATYELDVDVRDWEDMARGPDEDGRSSLWLGDIGDNSGARDLGLLVHRVPEPEPGGPTDLTPTSFRLRYDDGPGDAETLLVHPRTGRLYVVGKPLAGPARVYAAPEQLDPAGPNALVQVAEAETRSTDTPGGPPQAGPLADRLVTAGDISPDGSRVALRTYTDLYEWRVPGDDVAAAFDGEPVVTPLPPTVQGEGLAYSLDGRSLLTSSEGEGAPVHRVPAGTFPSDPPDGRPGRTPVLVGAAVLVVLVLVREAVRRRRFTRR